MMEDPELSTTIEPAVKVETRRQPWPPRERLERIFQIEALDALYSGKAVQHIETQVRFEDGRTGMVAADLAIADVKTFAPQVKKAA